MLVFSLLLALALAFAQGQQEVILLPPMAGQGQEILLICIPGMYVPAREYVQPCTAIQGSLSSEASTRAWLGILGFTGNAVNPLEIRKGVDQAIELARRSGFENVTDDLVFVWAHSAGGSFSTELVAQRGFGGFLLFGSILNGYTLEEFPVPVLTVGGSLDGLMQSTRVAEEYRTCRDLLQEGREEEALARKPVVILEGMNHAQMCSGFIQGRIEEFDFTPEISLAEANRLIGGVSSAFISLQLGEWNSTRAAWALERLAGLVISTDALVGPFLQAQDEDRGTWCERTQALVANLEEGESLLRIENVEEPDFDSFVKSKASIQVNQGIAYIVTHSFRNMAPLPTEGDVGIFAEGSWASELGCKSRSQDSVLSSLGGPPAHGPRGTCRETHKAMLELALETLAPRTRERYLEQGRPLIFEEDRALSTGAQWVESHVEFDEGTGEVRASSLLSPNIPGEFGGAFYCKGLAAARVFAWVMHDSLPRGLKSRE